MVEVEIEDIKEFGGLLKRLYELETILEMASKWEAYISSADRYKDLLFKISQDSERHKRMLEDLIMDIQTLNLDEVKEQVPERRFDYSDKTDQEIMNELLKYEKTALHAYKKLYEGINDEILSDFWTGEEGGLRDTVEQIISDEKKHIQLVRKHSDSIEWE